MGGTPSRPPRRVRLSKIFIAKTQWDMKKSMEKLKYHAQDTKVTMQNINLLHSMSVLGFGMYPLE